MVRLQILLGLLLSLVLATSAVAQTSEGTFDTNGGSGSGNANSGAGSVPTTTPAPRPAPTRAPAPAATRAPVATPRPTVAAPAPAQTAPAPKATPKPKAKPKKKAAAKKPAESGCLSSREKAVLQHRAAGDSIAKTAAALDLSKASVVKLQERGANRLLSAKDTCARDRKDSTLAAARQQLTTPRLPVSKPPVADAAPPQQAFGDPDLLVPKRSGVPTFPLLVLGGVLLLGLVALELRKRSGVSAYRDSWDPYGRS